MNNKIINNDELDLKVFLEVLNDKKKIFIYVLIPFFLLSSLYIIFAQKMYKSSISIYPNNESLNQGFDMNELQGVSSFIGLDLFKSNNTYNISDIVKSRMLKKKIIYNLWDINDSASRSDLINYWEINNENSFSLNPFNWFDDRNVKLKWEELALEEISDRITVNEEPSGLLTIDVLMEEPLLAAAVNDYIYLSIIDFTNSVHLKSAKLNTEFILNRKNDIKSQLFVAENNLKEFRSQNREVLNSPQLQLELERLLREVEIQTQVYITLQKQYEISTINEVKETPAIVLLDSSSVPSKKFSPNEYFVLPIMILLGILFSIIIILIAHSIDLKKNTLQD